MATMHFVAFDDATVSNASARGKQNGGSSQSTPDMTATDGRDDLLRNPYVPENAMDPSPDPHRLPVASTSNGLPHTFVDDYTSLANDNVAAMETGYFTGRSSPPQEPQPLVDASSSRRSTLTGAATEGSVASFMGNPFALGSSDDEAKSKKAKKRVVKASPAPPLPPPSSSTPGDDRTRAYHDGNNRYDEGGMDPFTNQVLDFENQGGTEDEYAAAFGGRGFSSSSPGQHRSSADGPATTAAASAGGGNRSIHPSIARRQSSLTTAEPTPALKPQSSSVSGVRKKSVAIALAQSRPKDPAVHHEDAAAIQVLSTHPQDNGVQPKEGAYSAEDRASVDKATEQLFMPNMKREQYIPVRVAREKIKLVLAEMAQMKQMHLSAIDTMEKQYQLLKAQLETTCAAYCRKLTGDYNNRLTALNREYQRRLTNAGGTHVGGGGVSSVPPLGTTPRPASGTPPSPAPHQATPAEYESLRQHVAELKAQLAATQGELDRAIHQTHDALERADEAERDMELSRASVRAFEKKTQALEAALKERSNELSIISERGTRDDTAAADAEAAPSSSSPKPEESSLNPNDARITELLAQVAAYEEHVGELTREIVDLRAQLAEAQQRRTMPQDQPEMVYSPAETPPVEE